MKRFLTIAVIALAFGYFFLGREFEDKTARVSAQPEGPMVRAPDQPVPPLITPSLAPAKSSPEPTAPKASDGAAIPVVDNGQPQRPPKGMISFVVKDDLVIAFGDVIIGKPTNPNIPEKGFIPAPKTKEWGKTEIAFSVHQDLPNPERVMRVIEYFNTNTPVRFVPLTNQKDSIVFAPTDTPLCLSYVGRIGGHQPIFLHDRCDDDEITHEVMHSLGYVHEHSRPDRDNYVTIRWGNIDPEAYAQFEIVPDFLAESTKGRPFDYNSVMMYNETAFGRVRGDITMESQSRDEPIAPVENGLSSEDLQRLIIKYGGGRKASSVNEF